METLDFSVLMTTYHGEKPEHLDASLDSILVNQTRIPNQMVLVVDGPISQELDEVIVKYKNLFPDILEVVYCAENRGQSKASAEGFQYLKNEIFARMDSDDLCVRDRFEKQIEVFQNNPEIGVVGGWIAEFDDDWQTPHSLRSVPETHEEIIKTFRKRNPINNMTAMLKKSEVERAGGYGRDTVNEDYSLYVHMWVNGTIFYNVQEVLCYVRVGNGMVGRRNDFRIYKDWRKDQKYLHENHKHSAFTCFKSNFRCFMFVITPRWVKKLLYKTVLRKPVSKKEKKS